MQLNQETMAERLWQNISIRNRLMSIAEDLSTYFMKKEREGNRKVRYVSVKTIEFEDTHIGDINQFNVVAEYLSDQGTWKERIIVRQFNSVTQFNDEVRQQRQMEKELQFHEHLRVLPIIMKKQDENYVVYEGGSGKTLDEINLDHELNEYILGMICAVIQGNGVMHNDLDNIKSMVNYLISISAFNDTQQAKIKELLRLHFLILEHSRSGYQTLSVLDTKYIWFTPLMDKSQISKTSIMNFKAFEIEMLYTPPQSVINDRMMDIAIRYGEIAFDEFSKTGSVHKTLNKVLAFLEGYESEYEKQSYYPLEEIYEFGLTLDLQIIIVTWLYTNHLINYSIDEQTKKQVIEISYNFICFLLSDRPFQFYDVDPSWYEELSK